MQHCVGKMNESSARWIQISSVIGIHDFKVLVQIHYSLIVISKAVKLFAKMQLIVACSEGAAKQVVLRWYGN